MNNNNMPWGHFILFIIPTIILIISRPNANDLIVGIIAIVIYYIGLRRFVVEVVEGEASARRERKQKRDEVNRSGHPLDDVN